MSNDKLLSNMDRAVLSMPRELAFAGDMAQLQYHERVQALIRRLDSSEAKKQAACTRCGGEGGWERETSSTQSTWIKCDECEAEKQDNPVAGQATAEVDAWASVPDGELWDEHQLDGIFDAVRGNCGPATASRVRAILRAFQTVTPSSERDKEDAADFRWLLTQFRAMSLDMGGNHYWVLARSGSLRGPTIADAVRAARATNEER